MSNSICRVFVRRNLSVVRAISQSYNSCFLQFLKPFSSTAKPISKTANQNSFAVNYLINTLGFSPEKALSASKYLNLKSPDRPDSVIAFLNKQGFTNEQVRKLLKKYPPNLLCNPQKIMSPKIEYFRSLGFSDSEVREIFMTAPAIFAASLERLIAPSFNYIKNIFDKNGISTLGYMRTASRIMICGFESRILPNIEVLKISGVPDSNIAYLLRRLPRAVTTDAENFKKLVEEVKEMGFDPLGKRFIQAVLVLRLTNKSFWEKKVAAFEKWGISQNEIMSAFRLHPRFMSYSTEKITAFMDFFVYEMGFDASIVVKGPALVSYSLDKRIKPRALVYKVLLDNGLIKKGSHSILVFQCTEECFLKKYVHRYLEKAPGLLEVYQKELAISKVEILQSDDKCKSIIN